MKPNGHRKDVLITGASGVIGTAIAGRLAASGFNLHLTSRDSARLKELRRELEKSGIQTWSYDLELSDLPRCERVVDEFFSRSENPFGLVCNAGDLGILGSFLDVDFGEWSKSLQHNFLGHAAMMHAFGRAFLAQGRKGGAIVLLSGAGLGSAVGHTHLSSYGTAKAALTYLSEALAPELKELDMTINAIAPGQVKSGITKQAIQAGVERAGAYAEAAQKCMDKGGVSPDLGAELVDFLMSPAARRITGRLLSARFDQKRLREKADVISENPDLYRLRRIDDDLFARRP